jgi:S-adenosyl-L-methionine hydrolase (adenosine-forming)
METTTSELPKIITLLTDFGHLDPYVGIMKGVILGICPRARIIDLTHEVVPYEIPQAAFLLQQSWPWFPKGTIHVVVVDPGVGTARRPILVEAAGHRFIGPDNGVFSMLDPSQVIEIKGLTASKTFHGRDLFAPTAARLANGNKSARLGKRIDDHLRLTFHEPTRTGRRIWAGSVLHIDRFGNIITNLRAADFPPETQCRIGFETVQRRASTYAEVPPGELFLIEGSSGYLEIALNQASAAKRLGVGVLTVLEASI